MQTTTAPWSAKPIPFPRSPRIITWEITRGCELGCTHCYGDSEPKRHPRELSTEEGRSLLAQIRRFRDPPRLVLTGGDPMLREDIFALTREAVGLGLRVSLQAGAPERLDPKSLQNLQAAGVDSISLGLDGDTDLNHDGIRGVQGCFTRTLSAAQDIRRAGLGLEINTLVSNETVGSLAGIHTLLQGLDIHRWNLFFLIPGRAGQKLSSVNGWQCEVLLHWLDGLSGQSDFSITTTAAPQFRRVAVHRMRTARIPWVTIRGTPIADEFGLRAGNGLLSISHVGDVFPSEFLPVVAGNVRGRPLLEIYRRSRVFRVLRESQGLKGKCSRCPFRGICGGCRDRAYAVTGDWLAPDPLCPFDPLSVAAIE